MKKRKVVVKRKTKETDITLELGIDGKGKAQVKTGIGFLDHMLTLFTKHGLFDLKIKAKGDLEVDIHHTNEDVGICLGTAIKKALGNKKGIKRFGTCFVPMDEALAKTRVVLDISGRPSLYLKAKPSKLKTKSSTYGLQDAKEFLKALCLNSGMNMHVDILRGEDIHHMIEAVFKALGRALDEATRLDKRVKGVPSTKGKL